jgi:hypothetical protein
LQIFFCFAKKIFFCAILHQFGTPLAVCAALLPGRAVINEPLPVAKIQHANIFANFFCAQ